jgi:hypothetical protein
MVVRRKYRAKANHVPAVADVAAAAAPAPPDAPGPAAGGGGPSPLQAALEAQRHPEHLQHQHGLRQQAGLAEPPIDATTRQAVDQHIDNMPGLSEWKRRFLKSHRSLLAEPYASSMRHAHAMALHAGLVDDSPQMDSAILAGVAKDVEHHRALSALTSAQPRPTPQMHQGGTAEAAAELQREAGQHLAALKPQRRTMPISAPVSRDIPLTSGHRSQDRTLSADERQIARASMPHLPADQAEYQYLINRRRMHEMKASGEIQGDR